MMKTGKVVKPNRTQIVTEVFNIPDNLAPSTLNCPLIELQYWLKVNRAKTLYILTGTITIGLALGVFSLFQIYTSLRPYSCFFLVI